MRTVRVSSAATPRFSGHVPPHGRESSLRDWFLIGEEITNFGLSLGRKTESHPHETGGLIETEALSHRAAPCFQTWREAHFTDHFYEIQRRGTAWPFQAPEVLPRTRHVRQGVGSGEFQHDSKSSVFVQRKQERHDVGHVVSNVMCDSHVTNRGLGRNFGPGAFNRFDVDAEPKTISCIHRQHFGLMIDTYTLANMRDQRVGCDPSTATNI